MELLVFSSAPNRQNITDHQKPRNTLYTQCNSSVYKFVWLPPIASECPFLRATQKVLLEHRFQYHQHRTDGEWEELIKEYNASGLSQGVFCEQRGVNFDSFRRRYRRSPRFSGKRRKPSQKAFSELTRPLPPPTGGLVVWLGETVCIDLIRSSHTLPVE